MTFADARDGTRLQSGGASIVGDACGGTTRGAALCLDLEKYVLAVGLLKLFSGAFAWQASAEVFDYWVFPLQPEVPLGIYTARYQTKMGLYLLRALFVGFCDTCFCTFGGFLAWLIEQRGRQFSPEAGTKHDLRCLWLAAFVVGFAWQFENDLACALHSATTGHGFVFPNNPHFSPAEVLWNLLVYGLLQSLLFRLSSRVLCRAAWAEGLIDIQVGLAGFGFYLAGFVSLQSNQHWLRSANAGAWTSMLAIAFILPVLAVRVALPRRSSAREPSVSHPAGPGGAAGLLAA